MESLVFLLLALYVTVTFIRFLRVLKKANNNPMKLPLPPGPKPWPFIGCLPQLIREKPFFKYLHNVLRDLDTEIACIRLGSVHVIVVTCPKVSCNHLKEKDSVFASRPLTMATSIVSDCYLTTILSPYGDQWKKMRRVMFSELLSPARHNFFHRKRLEEANHLVKFLYNKCLNDNNNFLVNLRYVSQHYCANLIRNIVFGKRSFAKVLRGDGSPGFEDEEHVGAIFTVLNHVYAFCVSDYVPCLRVFDFGGHKKIMKRANGTIRRYQDPIIKERYEQWNLGNKKEVEDLLDMFITLKDDKGNPLLSINEVKAQMTEIMLAPIDNPSNAVEWALAEMMNQPDILAKALEELDRVVGKERLVQESDLSQLNYIKACAREAFRLHPIVAFNAPHISMADTTIGNYFIPKGSHLLLSRMGLGRNPNVWDEPNHFKPERHLGENGCDQVTLAEPDMRFISFGIGRRGCPGVTLGTSITLMLFARLLQGFEWRSPCGQTSIDLTESENGLMLAKPLVAIATPRLPAHLYFT